MGKAIYKLEFIMNQDHYKFRIDPVIVIGQPPKLNFTYHTSDYTSHMYLDNLSEIEYYKKQIIISMMNANNRMIERYQNINRVLSSERWKPESEDIYLSVDDFKWPLASSYEFDSKLEQLKEKL